ncbi:unnamed protein product [Spirodela intermedia]|uniref:C2H2-type domain-containing protein n=1 Tax=Spirodela intermedia TaxID=51605 RepID=A0A7I8L9N9_SPIIN|nr:unnamed protein product [Spirodela intermedia]
MEQTNCWTLTRTNLGGMPHFPPIAAAVASWEEKAIADDPASHLGEYAWPPRSYSCSFCGREFRSAQALGGHMNVHRRDRARLKQSSAGHEEKGRLFFRQQQHHLQNSFSKSRCTPYAVVAPPRSPSLDNCGDHKMLSLSYSSRLVKEGHTGSPCSITSPHEKPSAVQKLRFEGKTMKLNEMDNGEKRNAENDAGVVGSGKRSRFEVSFPFIVGSSFPCDGSPHQSDVRRLSTSSSCEEVDLELRLGYQPEVK